MFTRANLSISIIIIIIESVILRLNICLVKLLKSTLTAHLGVVFLSPQVILFFEYCRFLLAS